MSTRQCSHCKEDLPLDRFYYNSRGVGENAIWLDHRCKTCQTTHSRQLREAKKKAGPKPDACECCGRTDKPLLVDHIRGTSEPRGWICKSCNTGMGLLGDNIEGLMQAVHYLNETTNRC